ncbi:MAG: glycosyltransferase family 4 protein [Flavobacteriaceae bacterium]|nr:glycosyltransferase family 4 protein [Flavobacteriaceae bacterium]
MGASSRLRTYQFISLWEQAGYEVKISSFFNEKYLRRFYLGKRHHPLNVLGCYIKRLWIFLNAWRYDLIWIEKEAFPFLPSYAEWLLEKLGKGYVVDYDDAVFHNYDQHASCIVRAWMGNKIDWVMRHSTATFVGNLYLKERALKSGAKEIIDLPTVINPIRYRKKIGDSSASKIKIGWIGSPTTMKYLETLKPVFEKLNSELDFELLVVNAKPFFDLGFGCEVRWVSWSEETEVEAILEMDIGIMPLPDDKWERGKCAYKLIQYMACGLPVVASPVGMNVEVVKHGENGFLASSEEEWVDYLNTLIQNSSLRKEFGGKGYQLVQERYTLQRNFEIMRREIERLMK